jgi:hypothetical protein
MRLPQSTTPTRRLAVVRDSGIVVGDDCYEDTEMRGGLSMKNEAFHTTSVG